LKMNLPIAADYAHAMVHLTPSVACKLLRVAARMAHRNEVLKCTYDRELWLNQSSKHPLHFCPHFA